MYWNREKTLIWKKALYIDKTTRYAKLIIFQKAIFDNM